VRRAPWLPLAKGRQARGARTTAKAEETEGLSRATCFEAELSCAFIKKCRKRETCFETEMPPAFIMTGRYRE
jgi:hypothetical protein